MAIFDTFYTRLFVACALAVTFVKLAAWAICHG